MNELKKKLRDAIYGHLVADAVGTSYEFKSPGSIPPYDQIEMTPPLGYKKSWSAFPPGYWSDDGSQTLCLLEHYIEEKNDKRLWYDRWAEKLVRWYDGHMWVGGQSFDSGIQTQEAIQNLKWGKHPLQAARVDEYANGNGSLMRALPTAIMCYHYSDTDFYQEVENISCITHPHPRSLMSCVLYCEIARELIRGNLLNAAIELADDRIRRHYSGDMLDEYEKVWDGQFDEPQGSGYVVNALWSAIYALRGADTYEDVVKRAIELGNDTDTTACIAGGLAGIIYGYESIPQRWLDQMASKNVVDDLLERV